MRRVVTFQGLTACSRNLARKTLAWIWSPTLARPELTAVLTRSGLTFALTLLLCPGTVLAEPPTANGGNGNSQQDLDNLEAKAQAASIQRFKEFMQDKNIQTKAKGPDGKQVQGKLKHNMNPDDQNPFESDLTYHSSPNDQIKVTQDPSKPNDPDALKVVEEKAFKSPHGKLSSAGGSSALERASESVDKKFSQQDQKKPQKPQKGVEYDGMFMTETREVTDKDIKGGKKQGQGQNPNGPNKSSEKNPKDEAVTVYRKEIRKEGVKDFEDVGTAAGQTVIESAKDPSQKGDPKALANGVLLRVAAAENLGALWRNFQAKLAQRREYKAIPGLGEIGRIRMNEEKPRCQDWEGQAKSEIAKLPKEVQESYNADLKEMMKQCNEIARLPYDVVSPKYEEEENSTKEKLAFEGPKSEDGIERDLRVNLKIMEKAGTSVTELPSNWNYSQSEDQVKVKRYQKDGSFKEETTTAAQEIEYYNQNLQAAKEGYEEAAKKLPGFKAPDPTQYAIGQKTESMMEISQAPAGAMEEYGIKGQGSWDGSEPRTYDQLLNSTR